MSIRYGPKTMVVPAGLSDILRTLSREVIFSQPDDIHEFSAKYLKKLVVIRSSTGEDPVLSGYRLESIKVTGKGRLSGRKYSIRKPTPPIADSESAPESPNTVVADEPATDAAPVQEQQTMVEQQQQSVDKEDTEASKQQEHTQEAKDDINEVPTPQVADPPTTE